MPNKKIVILNATASNAVEILFQETASYSSNTFTASSVLSEIEKKKRGRKPTRMYFTHDTENAIVAFCAEKDPDKKNRIYVDDIQYAFDKLAENMINTFSFSYIGDTYDDIKSGVVAHMLLNIDKYRQPQGKAFGYFSVMAKNYLIIANNESYKEMKITRSIESNPKSDQYEFDIMDDTFDKSNKNQDTSEFIKLMVIYWEKNIATVFKKKRDIEIAYSVVELFRNVSSLEFFNKKALYLLIREMTGHKTQYITRVINKMYSHYNTIKKSYYKDGTIKENVFFDKKK